MGFKNFILRKGLGSPGQTARIWANNYNQLLAHGYSEREALEGVFSNFQHGQSSVNNLAQVSSLETTIKYSDDDLAVLIFALLCDTKGYIQKVLPLFDETTEIIYEEIQKIAPGSIQFDLQGFKQKARNILMFHPY